jgi:excisionase family DNA binding protein
MKFRPDQTGKQLFSLIEAAEILKVSRSTVRDMVACGQMRSVRGKKSMHLIPIGDIERQLALREIRNHLVKHDVDPAKNFLQMTEAESETEKLIQVDSFEKNTIETKPIRLSVDDMPGWDSNPYVLLTRKLAALVGEYKSKEAERNYLQKEWVKLDERRSQVAKELANLEFEERIIREQLKNFTEL